MPSPFPGMDPYLEAHHVWPDVHASMITNTREGLQPQLWPKYIARIGERVLLANASRSYVPDVLLIKSMREPAPTLTKYRPPVADEPRRNVREPFIEIIACLTGDVVTLIELLSPARRP